MLNKSMNIIAQEIGIDIIDEKDLDHYLDSELRRMVRSAFKYDIKYGKLPNMQTNRELLECIQKKCQLTNIRLNDTVEICNMIVNRLHEEKTKKLATTIISPTIPAPFTTTTANNNNNNNNNNNSPLSKPTSDSLDRFIVHERLTLQKQLLEDCQTLIATYQNDFNSRPDPFTIRTSPPQSLLSRLQTVVGNPVQVSTSDCLLLLNRLIQTESDMIQARNRLDIVTSEAIHNENRRITAEREKKEWEGKAGRLEADLSSLRQTVESKQTEIEMWKKMADNVQQPGQKTAIPSSFPSNPLLLPNRLYEGTTTGELMRNQYGGQVPYLYGGSTGMGIASL